MKQALGLAVSGTEVRVAHLVMHKGQIQIEALERARLMTTLEFQPSEVKTSDYAEPDPKDVFGLKEARAETGDSSPTAYKRYNENMEILYGLLEKFTRKKKIKTAFNVPVSMVNYVREGSVFAATQTSMERNNGVDKDSGPNWVRYPIKSQDGTGLSISYERQPPTMSLLNDVKGFLRGNLYLAHMDTSEVSLANIARSRRLEANKLTAIIYIEDDFTRLIFMRGEELFHVSSIIHESATSPDMLEVICRKLIYEQDEANMPEISSILLAGRCHRLNAKEFFAERFYGINVDYLWTNKLGRFPANDRECEAFSEFAVPIALAWKTLQPKHPAFLPVNLLPQEIRDQQEVLKLSYHGYVLLAITGIVAFMLTWQILSIRNTTTSTRVKNAQLELQIKNNQSTVDKVLELENESRRLHKNLSLADSLSRGHDEFLVFLKNLNSSVRRSGNLWVDEIAKQKEGFSISGTSMNRESIPILAEKLGGVSLRKVTRSEASGSRRLFEFAMEQKGGANLAKTSGPDVGIIDGNSFSRNGNLILSAGNDGVRSSAPAREQTAIPNIRNESPLTQNNPRQALTDNSKPAKNGVPETKSETKSTNGAQQPATLPAISANQKKTPVNPEPETKSPKTAAVRAPASSAGSNGRTSEIIKEKPPASSRTTQVQEESVQEKVTAAPQATNGNDGNADRNSTIVSERLATTERSAGVVFAGQQNVSQARDSNKIAAGVDDQRATQSAAGKSVVERPDRYRAYSIEAAVSYTKNHAEQAAVVFRKRGLDVVVQDFYDERYTATRYRVLVGLFATSEAAAAKAAQLGSLLMKGHRIIGL